MPASVVVGSDPVSGPRYYYVYNGHGDVVALAVETVYSGTRAQELCAEERVHVVTYGAQHVFLVIAIAVGIGSLPELFIVVLVRHEYRTTRQHWPHAGRIWALFAIGMEGLLCGGLCAILPPLLTGTWPHHPLLLYDAPLLTILSVGGTSVVIAATVPLVVGMCMADGARLHETGQQSHRLVMPQRDAAVRTGGYSLRGKALHFTTVLSLSLFPVFGVVTVSILATLILSGIVFLMSYAVAVVTLRRSLPPAGETPSS